MKCYCSNGRAQFVSTFLRVLNYLYRTRRSRRRMIWFLRPPPPSLVRKPDRRHIVRLRKRDNLLTGEGEGAGKEPNITTARKPGSSINHSILSGIPYTYLCSFLQPLNCKFKEHLAKMQTLPVVPSLSSTPQTGEKSETVFLDINLTRDSSLLLYALQQTCAVKHSLMVSWP